MHMVHDVRCLYLVLYSIGTYILYMPSSDQVTDLVCTSMYAYPPVIILCPPVHRSTPVHCMQHTFHVWNVDKTSVHPDSSESELDRSEPPSSIDHGLHIIYRGKLLNDGNDFKKEGTLIMPSLACRESGRDTHAITLSPLCFFLLGCCRSHDRPTEDEKETWWRLPRTTSSSARPVCPI